MPRVVPSAVQLCDRTRLRGRSAPIRLGLRESTSASATSPSRRHRAGPLARMLEDRGQESLVVRRAHPHCGARTPCLRGRSAAAEYWRCSNLFMALTAATLATAAPRRRRHLPDHRTRADRRRRRGRSRWTTSRRTPGVGAWSAGWNRLEIATAGPIRARDRADARRVEGDCARSGGRRAGSRRQVHRLRRSGRPPEPLQRPHRRYLVGGLGPTILGRV